MPRPACPARLNPATPTDLLDVVADRLVSAHQSVMGPALVRVRAVADQVELAVQPVPAGVHPADALLGQVVPSRWSAAGVIAGGTAHRLEPADQHAVTLAVLVDRSGHVAQRVIDLDGVAVTFDEQPRGRLVDLLLRSLGRPTDPPEDDPRRWWAAAWLDAVVAHAARAPVSLTSVDDVLLLHPLVERRPPSGAVEGSTELVTGALALSWSRLRHLVAEEGPPVGPAERAAQAALPSFLGAHLARWMDDGCLARWLIGELPSVDELLAVADALLPAALAAPVRARVVASLASDGEAPNDG